MRAEQQTRPYHQILKSLTICATVAASLIFNSPALMAADEATEADQSTPSTSMFSPVRKSVESIQNLFTDVKQYLGIRYRFGGDSPSGFDCSGFVSYMFNKTLDVKLPHSSQEMATMGEKVSRSELKPGDLVLFKNGKNRINHVGIFVGNDTFVHSSLSKGITRDTLNESYYDKRFATGVRILDVQDSRQPDDLNSLIESVIDENSAS
ncbi:MAG: NlpC/P60 family protein [Chlorobaculum sp.]|nr:NlpC/P60 family protein [Chlorobaculum sp.]